MTEEEFQLLNIGDIVRSASNKSYIITCNLGDTKIAVDVLTLTNPSEWDLIFKANLERKNP